MSTRTVLCVITLVTLVAMATAEVCSDVSAGSLVGDSLPMLVLQAPSNQEEFNMTVPSLCPGKMNGLQVSACDVNNMTVNIVDMSWISVRRNVSVDDVYFFFLAYCEERNESQVLDVGDIVDNPSEVGNTSEVLNVSPNVNETLEVNKTSEVDKTAEESIVRRKRRSAPKNSKTPKRDKKMGLDKMLEDEVDKTSEVRVKRDAVAFENITSELDRISEVNNTSKVTDDLVRNWETLINIAKSGVTLTSEDVDSILNPTLEVDKTTEVSDPSRKKRSTPKKNKTSKLDAKLEMNSTSEIGKPSEVDKALEEENTSEVVDKSSEMNMTSEVDKTLKVLDAKRNKRSKKQKKHSKIKNKTSETLGDEKKTVENKTLEVVKNKTKVKSVTGVENESESDDNETSELDGQSKLDKSLKKVKVVKEKSVYE